MSRTYNFRNYFACWEAWLFLCHLVLITLYEIIRFIMSLAIPYSIRNMFSCFFSSERKQCTDCLMNVEEDWVVLMTHICHNITLTVFCSQILLNSANTKPRQWGVGGGEWMEVMQSALACVLYQKQWTYSRFTFWKGIVNQDFRFVILHCQKNYTEKFCLWTERTTFRIL